MDILGKVPKSPNVFGKVDAALWKLVRALRELPFNDNSDPKFSITDEADDLVRKTLESPLFKDTLPSGFKDIIENELNSYNTKGAKLAFEYFKEILAHYKANVDCDLCACENFLQFKQLTSFVLDAPHYNDCIKQAEDALILKYRNTLNISNLAPFEPLIDDLNICIHFRDKGIEDPKLSHSYRKRQNRVPLEFFCEPCSQIFRKVRSRSIQILVQFPGCHMQCALNSGTNWCAFVTRFA